MAERGESPDAGLGIRDTATGGSTVTLRVDDPLNSGNTMTSGSGATCREGFPIQDPARIHCQNSFPEVRRCGGRVHGVMRA